MPHNYNPYDERTIECAAYISESEKTVREAAAHFGLSKSTVHKDVTTRLYALDKALYERVRKVLDIHKAERHMRGGLATKRKYEQRKKEENRK